jgi:PAS domain S-box-containing protein
MNAEKRMSAKTGLRVLMVEDSHLDADLILSELKKGGFETASTVVDTAEAFTRELTANPPDIVLADYNLPHWCGMEALKVLREQGRDIPVILVTGSLGDVKAVECLKQGATDYVLKDQLGRLPLSVRRALAERQMHELQKRAEGALRDSQARLEATIHSAMDAIITVDEQRRVVVFNAAAEAMFGCTGQKAIGQLVERFIPEGFRTVHAGHQFGENAGGARTVGGGTELQGLRANGEEFSMEASVSRAQVGAQELFTVIMRDVTERKKSEEALAEKIEELGRSNRELEQFAYVASHDLQEPLRMVASYTQLLAERYRGKLDENANKYIGYASEGATRMQALIQDLLTFSRVGRHQNDGSAIDSSVVVQDALTNLRTAIQESGAAIHCEALPVVCGERTQLIQLFQNLISNALKFRGKDAPEITVRAEPAGESWQFSVSDNGIGIAPEHAEVVFSIFQRLHTRSEYPGNGIGLAVCKKIVERSGGKIWVESKLGTGSTFKFTVPVAARTEASKDAAYAASA